MGSNSVSTEGIARHLPGYAWQPYGPAHRPHVAEKDPQLLDRLARQGTAILMISSELPELLASADRILVMREGRLLTDVPSANADEQILLRLMVGTGGTAA